MDTVASWWARGGKRTFDVLVAAGLGLLVLPLVLLCAPLVLAVDGRPAFFRQTRVGRHARAFRIVKLRTMRPGPGRLVTSGADPRITRLGAWLRRTKLDELPQLWLVLRGEMSLVGPRPEVPAYVAAQRRSYRAIAELRPGMTDWASVIFQDEETLLRKHAGDPEFYECRLLPRKLALARLYHRRVSGRIDLAIVAATGCAVLGLRRWVPRILGQRFVARARSEL